jgi:hypothetical protein
MNKEFIFNLSKQVMNLAQENGISPKRLKTYTGVLIIASGVMLTALSSPKSQSMQLNSSPYKPTIEQTSTFNYSDTPIALDDMKKFLDGNGDAKVYKNPFARGESITLVHADNYKTLADLNDPDRWAAKVAVTEQITNLTKSLTYCSNEVDWQKPIVSLTGKCFSIINIGDADRIHANLSNKETLSLNAVRLFSLLHEVAHGQSTSRAMSAMQKLTETDTYRENFSEKISDVSAFIAISTILSKDDTNTLFDLIIQMRSHESSGHNASHNTHGLLVLAKKMFNEDPNFFKSTAGEDILFKATLMTKSYNDTTNKEVFFPNYHSDKISPSSIDAIVSRLQSRRNNPSRKSLVKALGVSSNDIHRLSKGETIELVMNNIDAVVSAVERSRTKNSFDNLVNTNVALLSPYADTREFKKSFDKLIGEHLDTRKGHSESIKKASIENFSMDQ